VKYSGFPSAVHKLAEAIISVPFSTRKKENAENPWRISGVWRNEARRAG